MSEIVLKKLNDPNDKEIPQLAEILEGSFATAMADCLEEEKDMPVPNGEDITKALQTELEIYKIYLDNVLVGGAVLNINRQTHHNQVELLFVSASDKGKGVGTRAWKKIEETFPDTAVWELGTPYFLKRNIHFYVNKCGFCITKYYNQWNPLIEGDLVDPSDFFVFEKVMK